MINFEIIFPFILQKTKEQLSSYLISSLNEEEAQKEAANTQPKNGKIDAASLKINKEIELIKKTKNVYKWLKWA